MKEMIKEGKATIQVFTGSKISKDLPVFYNPVMKLNRDISVLLLLALGKKKLRIGDVLAGSGVRSARFLLELPKSMVESININDGGDEAVSLIRKNLVLNKLQKDKRVTITKKDANFALLESSGFDYIEIDPFGSPAPFLDSAAKRISRSGILAITATDTAPLCGTYPKTCIRRYWAVPKKGGMMHEIGLRILIRRVQLIGAQYDKALLPILCYTHEHYFRAFFACEKGKSAVDSMMKQQGMLDSAGPLWLGALWDPSLTKKMVSLAGKNSANSDKSKELDKLLKIINEEAAIISAGFYDIHEIAKQTKMNIPPREDLMVAIRQKGYLASATHFKGEGIRSTVSKQELIDLMRKLISKK